MKYSITIKIGKDKYGYDAVKSEASLDAENISETILTAIIIAMVSDCNTKSKLKFQNAKTEAEAPPITPTEEAL